MTILSYHLLLETGWNRTFQGGNLTEEDEAALSRACGVILPQGCNEDIYRSVKNICPTVFPDYDARFAYPGKTGQAALFKAHGLPSPRSFAYQTMAELPDLAEIPLAFPFVFKSAWGGEGSRVFPVFSIDGLTECLKLARGWERAGQPGLVIQEYIETGGRSLRVVVIGNDFYSYWRVQPERNGFYSNLARGAVIDYEYRLDLQEEAVAAARKLVKLTGINLAGIDFLFASKDHNPSPLFLEINYAFRSRGLGGSDRYLELLVKGVKGWIDGLGPYDISQ